MQGAVIAALGARSPLGLYARSAAAAVRAGISAARSHHYFVDGAGDAVPSACDRVLPPTLYGAARLQQLALPALHECLAGMPSALARGKLALFLALPEQRPGFSERDSTALADALVRGAGSHGTFASVTVACEGHAAGLSLLDAALQSLARASADACVVGGVDSYFHPDTMAWLLDRKQLVGSQTRDGFVPGEGAAFLVLCPEHAAPVGSARARVEGVAVGAESRLINTQDVCLGEGLSEVLRRALEQHGARTRPIDNIFCDINGARYRGEEWGFASLRAAELLPDPTAYVSPASYWGDVGAASGPMFAVLACESAARGYAPGPCALLWASSEGGLRAAVTLALPMARSRGA